MKVLTPRKHYEVLTKYQDTLADKGLLFQPLEAHTPWSEVRKMILVEPLRSYSGHLLLTFGVWKHYLLHKAPEVTLLVIGIEKEKPHYPNYIDLLSGIEYFLQKLHAAGPISQDQNVPATFGTDLVQKWQRFVVGHGHESIINPMGEVAGSLAWIKGELMVEAEEEYKRVFKLFQNRTDVFQNTMHTWEELLNRWEKIQPFLPYFPFQAELAEIRDHINTLKPYFESGLRDGAYFLREKCLDKYQQSYHIIKLINNAYVPRPAQDIIG
jgi:hypothetical protein